MNEQNEQNIENKDNLFDIQLKRLEELKEMGINPYGEKFERSGMIKEYVEQYEEGKELKVAGRVYSARNMGKTKFWDLQDDSGKIQLFLHPKLLEPSQYELLSKLGVGDFVGVSGIVFKTKTGEISIQVKDIVLLSKSLRPMPEKYHGLKDVEERFRRRYLDLIANKEVKDLFKTRSKIISTIRSLLNDNSFLEVETPMLQALYGGALAKPFITHHNALDMKLYLRIAPELYLKRLLVGGFEKVYEINRNFRNEGLSRHHNPEFTMLEIYSAYDNYVDMMNLCENIIKTSARAINVEEIELDSDIKFNVNTPFKRISIFDAVKEYGNMNLEEWEDLRALGEKENIENWQNIDLGIILVELFERYVEEKLIEPTFVTDFPAIVSPLAKRSLEDDRFAERFELFINGKEIANAYSELNDPIQQKKSFEEQLNLEIEDVVKKVDLDYVRALEHGMPPAGGLGIGIDRLVMILTQTSSIREVILFPLLRVEEGVS